MSLIARSAMLRQCRCAQQSQLWEPAGSLFKQPSYSTSALDQQDKLILRGMVFHGHHGCFKEEKTLGQKFVVDAVLWADLARAGHSDKLEDTIDYSQVHREIQQIVQGPSHDLQESVAEQVCARLLALDSRVSAVQLYIRKPHVALPGVMESIGIEILRKRPPQPQFMQCLDS